MNFWEYMGKDNYDNERFGNTKRFLLGTLVFLIVPAMIYAFLQWDPVVGTDEDGDPTQLGLWVVLVMYWTAAFFSHRRYESRKRLNQLLDIVTTKSGLLHTLEVMRQDKWADEFQKGEERVKWFGIK